MKRVFLFLMVALLCGGIGATATRAQTTTKPCCTVTQLVQSPNVYSAKVNATGQRFTFAVGPTTAPGTGGKPVVTYRSVSVGQAIYANLTAKQVSFDGKTPGGTITAISAAPASSAPASKSAETAVAAASASAAAAPKIGSAVTSTPPPPCVITPWPPNTPTDTVGTAVNLSTCFPATCGATATISGNNMFQAGSGDWLVFWVPASLANCATPIIQARISSNPPNGICFDAFSNSNLNELYNGATGEPVEGVFFSQLVNGPSVQPLQPGPYYIRVHGAGAYAPTAGCGPNGAATGTWTLTITETAP